MILCGPQLERRGKARPVLLVTITKAVWFHPAARSRPRQDVGLWVPGAREGAD